MPKNYFAFEKWKKDNKVTNLELEFVARKTKKITNGTIGKKLSKGAGFDSEIIRAWQNYYGWTNAERDQFFFGDVIEEKEISDFSSDELLKELFGRFVQNGT